MSTADRNSPIGAGNSTSMASITWLPEPHFVRILMLFRLAMNREMASIVI